MPSSLFFCLVLVQALIGSEYFLIFITTTRAS
jgi:hypothetical protein